MLKRKEMAEAHGEEWDRYRATVLQSAWASGDERAAKIAKVLADCIRITQDGERRSCLFMEVAMREEVDGAVCYGWEEEGDG